MGIPEWFLHIDSRTTQNLHGGACVAFKLHFKGPKAHQLEQDFSKLVATGRLDEPTLFIPGYYNPKRKKRLGYRTCSVRDPNDKDSKIVKEIKIISIHFQFYFAEKKKFRITSFSSSSSRVNPKYFILAVTLFKMFIR